GYSLIRKVIETAGLDLSVPFGDETVGDHLLRPTHIYVKPVLELIRSVKVKAIAHITGGGIAANLSRVMPPCAGVTLSRSAWRQPAIFDWIREHGRIDESEMLRTFNCGLGMVLVVSEADSKQTLGHFNSRGIEAWEIGRAHAPDGEVVRIHD
ncbi:MAG: AIR synthase-related protein, partial [Arenicellales bacterium]